MAQFANITITKAGLNMIAQSQAGETLIFTKAKLGDGQVGDTNIQELTDIISAKLTAELTSVTAAEEGHVVIKFVVDNSSLETGFFVRELGIYAKVGEGGAEQLYGYTNAGNYTNWLSDKSIPIDAITTQIDLVVGNADEVAFISDKTLVYVTAQDLEDHNTSDAAHENRFSLFQKIATLGDEIVKKLALTTTITVITALQTNSWFGQLLKMVLNASGVKYSMAQNGYICLGSFFGGLIIQWGFVPDTSLVINYAISFSEVFGTVAMHRGIDPVIFYLDYNYSYNAAQVKFNSYNINKPTDPQNWNCFYIAIGR